MSNSSHIISAQVILRSAIDALPDATVIAENITGKLPSQKELTASTHAFRHLGFEVGEAVGNSFSITASPDVFEKVFNVEIVNHPKKGTQSKWKDDSIKDHLPLSGLPKEASGLVKAIVFPEAPDFGPGSY